MMIMIKARTRIQTTKSPRGGGGPEEEGAKLGQTDLPSGRIGGHGTGGCEP